MATTAPGDFGLYSPNFEHDACGVAFVANIEGTPSHRIVQMGITALLNLEHRGASGAEANTGDGAGILIQNPDAFWRSKVEFELPARGQYATGIAFISKDASSNLIEEFESITKQEGCSIVGWRSVPTDNSSLGKSALEIEPVMKQVFITGSSGESDLEMERLAFVIRKRSERELDGLYFPSLSTRTFIFKGMLTTPQVPEYFLDLNEPGLESAIALVHSRFSTNTFPAWNLAHPYRLIAHNGEINTVQGNRNWMRARQSLLESDLIPGDLRRIFPICTPGASDSASFDEVLELLNIGGRSLPHAVLMMIPEAWENHATMDTERRDFYRFHSSLMEPWDGPAAIAFTDGTIIGAVLDRNGLRPSRYWITDDGLVIMASEVGVIDVPPSRVLKKGRLQPGKMFLIDTSLGRVVTDDEIKSQLAAQHPYGDWLDRNLVSLEQLPPRHMLVPQHSSVVTSQREFGYTTEELRVILAPMAKSGGEPLGSMGSDTPIAVLSDGPRLLFDYFTQQFAQVTNPPLDAIREELVTSMGATIGPEKNLLSPSAGSARQIRLEHPIIDNDELAKLMYVDEDGGVEGYRAVVIDALFDPLTGGVGLAEALSSIRAKATQATLDGANIIILSDRHTTDQLAPIPILLALSNVHHHLVRQETRTQVGLVVETGEAREVHHMALLLSYGAAAINPYLAFDTIVDMIREGILTDITPRNAVRNYVKAATKGVLKVMSKMGISTVASYTGAQVFEAIGLDRGLINEYFTGTSSRIGGIGLDQIAMDAAKRHGEAHSERPEERAFRSLEVGGEYQWRREGEYHLFNPETVFKLQHSTRQRRWDVFRDYSRLVDDQSSKLATLRGLFRFRTDLRAPIPLDQVESASQIIKRFSTGAMSYGSISQEAHETLAIAMNRIGGKSNTGEGGEDPDRYVADPNGDSRRSAIKQVASGRFGVTAEYLSNADDIQIKMAQGAKPGEGGQLPGEKVYPWIAKTRYSTPGVGLISPPPHHDIYSIEDLAQLIHDLKSANPEARVHVKLVSEVGVGTVAAGVSKAHADVVLISGADGGTGASPLTSLKHAGAPWELGLAETQQTLIANGLRDRITVQVDGQLKTGRDVVIAALLGAEEFGFATAPLVVSGCIMMRVCHLDTCPVGIATQNPELRKRFSGKPEFVETFFEYIAEEVRIYLAELGFTTLEEAVGQVESLDMAVAIDHYKASGLDLSPIFVLPEGMADAPRRRIRGQDHGLENSFDQRLIELCENSLRDGSKVALDLTIRNVDRSVGATLGHEIIKRFGGSGLPDDTIHVRLQGSAGQSFGAFVPKGVTLELMGDSNDYLGKGLSGGKLIVYPPKSANFQAQENVIAGNVILYGATSGEVYISGLVGERFAVRNSGAVAVVEGVGDHGCEYMTGGRVVVLGTTGRNFGAGMSGGEAFVYDPDSLFLSRVNPEMVDLDPLEEDDRIWLAQTLQAHLDYTGSNLAKELLSNFSHEVDRFVKVFPKDYKRVLLAQSAARMQGSST